MKTSLALLLLLAAASPAAASSPAPLRVLATTTIVGDVVRAIGGAEIDQITLLATGQDPHTLEPAPRDAAAVARAQVLFLNGGELEHFLEPMIEANRSKDSLLVDLCEGLELAERATACQAGADQDHAEHHDLDPHVWFDPTLMARWADTIGRVLADRDPERAPLYRQRAAAYGQQLEELDRWIAARVAAIPEARRRLVTDHEEFGYLASRYGFTITGALMPSVSTSAEPSAREMAALETRIRASGTRVLVIGHGVNPALARRVAADTGLRIVTLYTGSLGEPGSPAATYLDYMRYNVEMLARALEAGAP